MIALRILEIKSNIDTKSTCTGVARTNLWFAHHGKLRLQLAELILFRQLNVANQFQKWFRILEIFCSTVRDTHKSTQWMTFTNYRTHIYLSRVLQILLTNWSGVTSQDSLGYLKFPRFVSILTEIESKNVHGKDYVKLYPPGLFHSSHSWQSPTHSFG